MSDHLKALENVNANIGRVSRVAAETTDAFFALHGVSMEGGSLSAKTKEMIAVGIAICVRCEGCIDFHVDSLISHHGATMDEIAEIVEVAVCMGGGPSVVYGGKAVEAAEQIFEAKKEASAVPAAKLEAVPA